MPRAVPSGAGGASAVASHSSVASTSAAVVAWLSAHSRIAYCPCRRVEETSAAPGGRERAHERRVARVLRVLAAGEAPAEADDAELRGRQQLELGVLAHARLGQHGEVHRRVDRGAERCSPEQRDRHPDLERARRAAELHAEVGEVDLLLVGLRVGEVVGHDRERAPQAHALADEQGAALERLVEPLVRIEGDGVGQLDPLQPAAPALGQRREAAVGAVDVAPRAARAGDLGELGQRVDRAGVGRAGAERDEQRPPPGGEVGVHRARQQVGAHAVLRVDGQHAHLVGVEAERARRAGQRRVRLVGDVEDEVVAHRAGQRLARARERGHVRARAAAQQDPGRARRVADPRLEPVEHLQLELARARGLHPTAGVDVERAGEEVAERPGHVLEPGMNAK